MNIKFDIDAEVNGQATATVNVIDEDSGEAIGARRVRLHVADDFDRVIGDTESKFGPDAAGRLHNELKQIADQATGHACGDAPAISPTSLRELWRTDAKLREPVIGGEECGLLRRGQVGNLVSTSKAYKTFLIIQLAITVVTRRFWLDAFPTVGGNVLLIDMELQKPDIVKRTNDIAAAMHSAPDVADSIDVLSLRGRNASIEKIEPMLLALAPRQYSLVVIDPLYKTYPASFDENSNAQMTELYRRFERIAEHLDGALMIVHHATKGGQADKRVVDVGAGAGSQSRSADCHIALREHDVDGCVVFDARVRSFRPPEPLVIRFEYPTWQRDLSLDPTALKSGKGRTANPAEPEPKHGVWTPERFAESFVAAEPKAQNIVLAKAKLVMSGRKAEDLLSLAVDAGLVHRWHPVNRKNPIRLATVQQPVTDTGGDHP